MTTLKTLSPYAIPVALLMMSVAFGAPAAHAERPGFRTFQVAIALLRSLPAFEALMTWYDLRDAVIPVLGERLTTIELSGGMSKLAGRVRTECSGLAMRKMAVGLRVEVAASGKVKSATPKGLQSEALGTCVAKIARTAKYRAARQGSEFEYTFRM